MAEERVIPKEEIRMMTRMFSDVFHYRPTKGEAENAYWTLRWWCEQNDYNMGELLNSLLPAIAYYALNFTVAHEGADKKGNRQVAIVLNLGTVPILRTQGRTGRRPTHKMWQS